MTQKALVIDNVAVNVCPTADLAASFHPDVAAAFVTVPDDVVVGSTYDGSAWHPPEDPLFFDPVTGTNEQRRARKLAEIEASRALRATLGIVFMGLWFRLPADQWDTMVKTAVTVLADEDITSISWDVIRGEFVAYPRAEFLAYFKAAAADIQTVNAEAITLDAAVLAVDDTQSTADYQADLDAIDTAFVMTVTAYPNDCTFGPWPTYATVAYP